MEQVPLSGRVVFVDWHGVLSCDPFWVSIRESARHPLRAQLEENLTSIFASDDANAWMKGLMSSGEVIAAMDIHVDGRFRDDFLHRRLYIDCARMKVNVSLFEVLRRVKAVAMVVVATDNMDCFADTFDHVRRSGRRRARSGAEASTMAGWAFVCDDIICSSDVAALKSEDPLTFFGPWLRRHAMTFADAMLIDDRADNCAAFQQQGGTALQWKMGTNDIAEIVDGLNQWLEAPARHTASTASPRHGEHLP
ncbi:hypothetical protein HII36_40020 [Nonomuraea sp. NN258]|uniref:hypothetical protein n=1 Tax=Nonomuraea antri TaxID=2730852 RepID=UPI0015697F7F|nr:hypothetical protein [Nonomuraea antri]NRQ37975.1 hypothetical protein [Nonomuraea antri]